MQTITFNSTKGEVKLTAHSGAGNGYHLYIANFYRGQFVQRNNEWVFLKGNIDLEEKVISAIIDIIKREHGTI